MHKSQPPPPLFSASKIDGCSLAVPARHPLPHMLAAMFSPPAQLEADTEMRYLNTYCPYTLYPCHTGFMSSSFQGSVLYVTPLKIYCILLHCIHSNECDPSAPHPPPEMSFDADGFLYGQQLIWAKAWARFRKEAAGLKELTPRMVELGGGGRWGQLSVMHPELEMKLCLSVFGTAEAVWESHGCSWGWGLQSGALGR